ncbi:MAG: hypothetical protein GC161_02940 [Planctomycetaceae bacterium]|nr:hypothetical protein [Planctomycetaceae bacterium]
MIGIEPTTGPRGPLPTREPLLLGALAFALYVVSVHPSSDALLLGNDVVPYAAALVEGERGGIVNPHHLLFHLLAALLAPLFEGLVAGPIAHALFAQIALSAVGGALATAAVWRGAWHLGGAGVARAVTALWILAAGNWLYGSVGETYLPATAALAWLWSDAIAARCGGRGLRQARLVGLLLLASLLRQDSVLALPWLLALVPARRYLMALAAAGALSLAAYAVAWSFAGGENGFVPWLRGLADSGLWGKAPGLDGVGVALLLTFAAQSFALARAAIDLALGRGLGFEALFALAPLVALAAAVPLGAARSTQRDGRRAVLIALLGFALTRFAFFAWWQPSNLEYHAGTLLPLVWLLALALARNPSQFRVRAGLVCAAAALSALGNWTLLLGPGRAREADRRAEAALAAAGEGGAVVALDALAFYGLERARGPGAGPELHDGSDSAGGLLPDAWAALRERLQAHVAAERTVAVSIDLVTPALMGTAPPHVATEVLAEILALGRSEVRRDADGRPWLLVIAP